MLSRTCGVPVLLVSFYVTVLWNTDFVPCLKNPEIGSAAVWAWSGRIFEPFPLSKISVVKRKAFFHLVTFIPFEALFCSCTWCNTHCKNHTIRVSTATGPFVLFSLLYMQVEVQEHCVSFCIQTLKWIYFYTFSCRRKILTSLLHRAQKTVWMSFCALPEFVFHKLLDTNFTALVFEQVLDFYWSWNCLFGLVVDVPLMYYRPFAIMHSCSLLKAHVNNMCVNNKDGLGYFGVLRKLNCKYFLVILCPRPFSLHCL